MRLHFTLGMCASMRQTAVAERAHELADGARDGPTSAIAAMPKVTSILGTTKRAVVRRVPAFACGLLQSQRHACPARNPRDVDGHEDRCRAWLHVFDRHDREENHELIQLRFASPLHFSWTHPAIRAGGDG
jgi:hypothetical protein